MRRIEEGHLSAGPAHLANIFPTLWVLYLTTNRGWTAIDDFTTRDSSYVPKGNA
jgi:hypothetical protein